MVHNLKEEYKVLVELSYFQGYTQDEIAKMLGYRWEPLKQDYEVH
jgi:DNA-directed RNA polymerase specialized sigma24 family protein